MHHYGYPGEKGGNHVAPPDPQGARVEPFQKVVVRGRLEEYGAAPGGGRYRGYEGYEACGGVLGGGDDRVLRIVRKKMARFAEERRYLIDYMMKRVYTLRMLPD